MTRAPLIGFEGPIGAGKTTLAELLAKHTGYDLVLERFDENEYLADFYAERARWGLPMQLWFLAERHKQLEQLTSPTRPPTIADYSGIKNEVFASLLLRGRDFRLYANLAASLARVVRDPDLLVYLDARDEVLMTRIQKRARSYEAAIDVPYLQGLREAYELHLERRAEMNVIKFDTSDLDLASHSDMEQFFSRVLRSL